MATQQTQPPVVGDVAVVVTHYRNPTDLDTCLRALTAGGGPRVREVVICDSEALPEYEPAARHAHPTARYLGFERNVGFAALVNAGVAASTAPYLLILNADIVIDPGMITTLAGHLDAEPEVGAVLPRLNGSDGELQQSIFRFYRPMTIVYRRTALAGLPHGRRELARFLDRQTLDRAVAGGHAVDVDWGLGASMLIRRAAWHQVGPMDAGYFLYFEDVDWCLRCWRTGWRVQYLPAAAARHSHRRASASWGLLGLITNPLTRTHITSAVRFFRKFGLRPTRPVPHAAGHADPDSPRAKPGPTSDTLGELR